MKETYKDEQFCDLIEQLQKIEINMQEVNMLASLAQKTILLRYENLLPEEINSKWLDYTAGKRLLNNSTALDGY